MVSRIAEVTVPEAEGALENANGNVKLAVLVARRVTTDQAEQLLSDTRGHLRPALKKLKKPI